MDPDFPFDLPGPLELLVFAYATEGDVGAAFERACVAGELHLADRLASAFALLDEPPDAGGRTPAERGLLAACLADRLEVACWVTRAANFGLHSKASGGVSLGGLVFRRACALGLFAVAGWAAAAFALTAAAAAPESGDAADVHALRGSLGQHRAVAGWLQARFDLSKADAIAAQDSDDE